MTSYLAPQTRTGLRFGAAAVIATSIGGCAYFSPDAGMQAVSDISAAGVGHRAVKIDNEPAWVAARERTVQLLRSALTPETAVEIALLNNQGLQAAYNELGITEAQLVAATLPPTPTVPVSYESGTLTEFQGRVLVNLIALLTLGVRREIAADHFREAQLRAAEATLALAFETRRMFYRAVSNRDVIAFLEKARLTAEAGSDLAKSLGRTGAMEKIEQARDHAFYYELSVQLAQARLHERVDREHLTRLMGLWGRDIQFRLPSALPPLPPYPKVNDAIEIEALERRVDLQFALFDLKERAGGLGLTEATRFISILDLGGAYGWKKTPGERVQGTGFEAIIQIPIYDLGESRLREAQQSYMQSVNRLGEKAINVRSQARQAYQVYRASYDIARQYQTHILPLRNTIVDESLLRTNGMLEDVFQLLVDARARINSNIAAIHARRNFFIAATDLLAVVVGGGGSRISAPLPAAEEAEQAVIQGLIANP